MAESEIRGYCFTPDEVIVDHQGHSRGTALAGKSWDRGKTLRILFLDGPADYHDRVATHVKTWEDCAISNSCARPTHPRRSASPSPGQ